MTDHAPRNIVLCSDGTGNRAVKGRGTNVFKLYEAVDSHGHGHEAGGAPQMAFYDDGVGTESFKLFKIMGGAFGWGLTRNVKDLYTALVRVYHPGDRIFLFGFSRGAFTVRTLAGLISGCGIVDRRPLEDENALRRAVDQAYKAYRHRYASWLQRLLRNPGKASARREAFRTRFPVHPMPEPGGDPLIHFLGVWDTVAAVGLPLDEATAFINRVVYRFSFPDTKLSPRVGRACHALAIDDERRSFHPMLWDHRPEDHDRIEQVWFSGVHTNVGGGYPKQGISLVALDWMMERAEESGLRFHASARSSYHERQNVHDKLYDSRSGGKFFYRYLPRDIDALCRKHHFEPVLHDSVRDRALLGTEGYAPGNVPGRARLAATHEAAAGVVAEQEAFRAALQGQIGAGRTSFLDRARGSITLRHYAHLAFVLGAVGTAAFAVAREMARSDASVFGAAGALRSFSGIVTAVRDPLLWPWLGAIAALLVVTRVVRGRVADDFAEQWFAVRRAVEGEPDATPPETDSPVPSE